MANVTGKVLGYIVSAVLTGAYGKYMYEKGKKVGKIESEIERIEADIKADMERIFGGMKNE